MKTSVLAVLMVLALCAGYAQTNFTMVATGQFDGRSSICVVGDTVYVVHNTCTLNQSVGQILLRHKSRSSTGNWVTKTIASTISGLTRPTISQGNGFMLISYVNENQRYMARSHNSWETWQTYNLGKSFETSPLIVPDGDYWVNYALDVPYPEAEQHNYLSGENSEYMLMPQYFTDQELAWWGGKIQFFGQDILNGVMRSNSDIWIQRAGGGPNNGWPIFNEMVITSGQILSSSGPYSLGGVFRGGLIQNAPSIALPSLNTAEASFVGPTTYNPNYIVYVTVYDNVYHLILGTITERVESVPYYSTYPSTNLGNPLGTNTYTTRDTLWTDMGTGPCGTGHYHSANQLWISGLFSNHQTWSSGDKIMLKGDIFLTGIAPGTQPPLNSESSVTLITMKDVEVKYGYKDPVTSQRVHLARNFFDPIYIYANIIALGNPSDPRSGKFTFEYQRPHPSVPAVTFAGSLWDKIDLHRRPYPQTAASPWPPLVDYPWYNPLWPERQPYLERGNLSIKGSLIQRRRGFVHRSYLDADYPYNDVWNLDQELYGGSCDPASYYLDPVLNIPMFPDDFPGTHGGGVGYSKNYTADRRIGYGCDGTDAPGINRYLSWDLGIRTGRVLQSGNQYSITDTFLQQYVKRIYSKAYTHADGHRLFAVNDALLHWNDGQYENLSSLVSGYGNIRSMLADNPGEVFVHSVTGQGASLVNKVLKVNLDDHSVAEVNLTVPAPWNLESSFSDIIRLADGTPYFVRLYPYQMKLIMWEIAENNTLTHRRIYDSSGFGDTYGAYSFNKLVVLPRADNSMDIFAWVHDPAYGANNIHGGRMYYSCLSAYVSNDEPLIPAALPLAMNAYPNPARGTLTVSLDGIKQQTLQVSVYNLRGQKVMDLENFIRNEDGSINMLWDGRDAQGKRLSGGVYMLKAIVDGKAQLSKRVTLIW